MPLLQQKTFHTTDKIRDAHNNCATTLAWSPYYFVIFKISDSEYDRFNPAVIRADDYDALVDNIAAEQVKLLDYPRVRSPADISISVVFIQNLMCEDRKRTMKCRLVCCY